MLYLVYCPDTPGKSDLRKAQRDAHRNYMSAHDTHIFFGGPTMAQDDGDADGTALLVNFPDIDAVHAFLDGDPYYNAGLFASRLVKPLQPVRIAPEVVKSSQEQITRKTE